MIGGFLIVTSLVAVLTSLPQGNTEPIFPAVVFIPLGLYLLIKKGKTKEEKQKIATKTQEMKELRQRSLSCKHVAGLPLAEGMQCGLAFEKDNIAISGGQHTFRVAYKKITDLAIKTDVDIQKAYVSSVGGAVGGAVLFGPLGAIVGGRAKEKTSKTLEHYFIITYSKDGAVDYLSFQILDTYKATKLIKQFKPLLSGEKMIVDL